MDKVFTCYKDIKTTEEMVEVGRKIADACIEANVSMLFLEGDLGAGKTTLTSGIARALGIEEEVTSPSFVINKKYYVDSVLKLSHYDFYRLEGQVGIMEEETREDVSGGALVVIEWGGGIDEILPERYIRAKITTNSSGERKVEVEEVVI
jgi:tRNA threonylcarbamoyladenosine biosynthesis protein TsaE